MIFSIPCIWNGGQSAEGRTEAQPEQLRPSLAGESRSQECPGSARQNQNLGSNSGSQARGS